MDYRKCNSPSATLLDRVRAADFFLRNSTNPDDRIVRRTIRLAWWHPLLAFGESTLSDFSFPRWEPYILWRMAVIRRHKILDPLSLVVDARNKGETQITSSLLANAYFADLRSIGMLSLSMKEIRREAPLSPPAPQPKPKRISRETFDDLPTPDTRFDLSFFKQAKGGG